MVTIRPLRDDERAWANATYRALRFAETPPGALALAAELDGAIVGLGRLVVLEPGVVELGGIWTADTARGRGVARAMVTALLERAPAGPLWCLPFAHLSAFYASFRFAIVASPWPSSVTAKLAAIAEHQLPPAVVLRRA
jgi:GNAT superfamily N-acetyltransferase